MPLYDPRRNPDPSEIRGIEWYAIDGFDARDGRLTRSMFRARSLSHAVQIAQRNAMCGDLLLIRSADVLTWQAWADGFVPGSGRLIVPRPTSGEFLGRLEMSRA